MIPFREIITRRRGDSDVLRFNIAVKLTNGRYRFLDLRRTWTANQNVKLLSCESGAEVPGCCNVCLCCCFETSIHARRFINIKAAFFVVAIHVSQPEGLKMAF